MFVEIFEYSYILKMICLVIKFDNLFIDWFKANLE